MNLLKQGIMTFQVLNRNKLPTGFDALVQVESAARLDRPRYLEIGLAADHLVLDSLDADQFARLAESGIDALMYVAGDQDPPGPGNCASGSIDDLIANRDNRVTVDTLFMTPGADGCGARVGLTRSGVSVAKQDPDRRMATEEVRTDRIPVMMWSRGSQPLTGRIQPAPYNADGNTAFLVLGIGPSLSLFDPELHGYMPELPIYADGGSTGYRRYMAVFAIGRYQGGVIVMNEDIRLAGIISPLGETSNEAPGEWDGDRNTI
jgi:hypothetical protein